jgi:hypothetical protein
MITGLTALEPPHVGSCPSTTMPPGEDTPSRTCSGCAQTKLRLGRPDHRSRSCMRARSEQSQTTPRSHDGFGVWTAGAWTRDAVTLDPKGLSKRKRTSMAMHLWRARRPCTHHRLLSAESCSPGLDGVRLCAPDYINADSGLFKVKRPNGFNRLCGTI